MTAASPAAPAGRRLLDLWVCWWVFPPFYTLFGIIFVPLTRVMPPPSPAKTTAQIVVFFHAHAMTIQIGFAILMLAIGGGSVVNGLVAYQMRRMTVDPVFSYAYIATLAVGAIPGCLFAAFSFIAATFRPDRDPHLIALCYDLGLLTFVSGPTPGTGTSLALGAVSWIVRAGAGLPAFQLPGAPSRVERQIVPNPHRSRKGMQSPGHYGLW